MSLFAARASDDDLHRLTAEVARMGGLAETQVAESVQAIARRDVGLARLVAGRDGAVDAAQREIERRAVALISASRRPSPAELRRILSAVKLGVWLERTGDLARNIARRAEAIATAEPMPHLTRSAERMGQLVTALMKEALDAYATQDLEQALAVWSRDREVDEHHDSLSREIIDHMTADPSHVAPGAHLLFVGKNLARIGDHATTVAELVHYEVTGREAPGDRPMGLNEL